MTTPYAEKLLPLPPGKFGLPLIGETISYLRDPYFAQKREKQYGQVFKTHLFGRPTVIMIGAEANRFVLTNENRCFSTNWPHSTRTLVGSGSLIVQAGGEHQNRRKLLSQAFQPRSVPEYFSTMKEITYSYLHKWQRMGTLTWYPELKNYTFDVACKLLVGTDAAAESNFGEWYEHWGEGIFSIPVSLPWTKFGRAVHCRKLLLSEIEKIVRKRQQDPTSSRDALGILLQARDEDGNSLSLQEVKEQVLTLLFAGHETLASALTSLCLLLAHHPEVVATVRAEQKQLEIEGQMTWEHLNQMSYLEQVLKEALRFIPPAFGAFRKAIKPFEFNGYFIPQGWSVLYLVGRTHQDTSIYSQPERFDPQRFAPERAEDKAIMFGYVPFGGGIRECLGKEFAKLEMKLFAALLVREYEWEVVAGQNLDMVMLPTPRPHDGLQVKFRRIEGD
jgi:retinoid hydroxylase